MYSTEFNGQITEFGTSGMLYRSNKLMYDRATETLWHQFLGTPVVGPLAATDIRLEVLPNVLTTWSEWLTDHPDTTVISNDTGVYPATFYTPEEDTSSIYFSYRVDPGTMFPVAEIDDSLLIKDQVFGLTFGDTARAYRRSEVSLAGVLNDSVGGQDVVLVALEGGRGAIRAYDGGGLDFEGADTGFLRDDNGQSWRVLEDSLENTDDPGRSLSRLPSRDAYWFGWQSFYPHTDIYSP